MFTFAKSSRDHGLIVGVTSNSTAYLHAMYRSAYHGQGSDVTPTHKQQLHHVEKHCHSCKYLHSMASLGSATAILRLPPELLLEVSRHLPKGGQ
ncbi:hypothetical protein PMIN01_09420 [Paraphaeosphaeria minitans]|uniref:Uncharacterized protein n=1 Tax=Paraphaeosphaeria minitans TaxID=565426 RepID=A0A9P6KN18_9PLEO|nr:hypothetical protein PMIN01_09420 [Paraphaeosphaeria minitans]